MTLSMMTGEKVSVGFLMLFNHINTAEYIRKYMPRLSTYNLNKGRISCTFLPLPLPNCFLQGRGVAEFNDSETTEERLPSTLSYTRGTRKVELSVLALMSVLLGLIGYELSCTLENNFLLCVYCVAKPYFVSTLIL